MQPPNQPPYPYQPQYPPVQPSYQPPPPVQPVHGWLYWTLLIFFFPITIPYLLLKAVLSRPRPAHPAHSAQHHRHAPTLGQQLRQMRRTGRSIGSAAKQARYMQQHGGRKRGK